MKLCIAHRTVYRYSEAPRRLVQTLRLTPRQEAGQQVLSWAVNGADPAAAQVDAWGNRCHVWTLERPTRQLVIEAGGVVITTASPWCLDAVGHDPGLYLRPSPLALADAAIVALARAVGPGDAAALLACATRGTVVAGLAGGQPDRLGDLGDLGPSGFSGFGALGGFVLALATQVRLALPYRAGLTHAGTTAAQALAQGAGVCQDQAHVFIAACRSLGLPARYVSGYRMAQPPHQSPAADAAGAVAQASHAWAEVCVDLPRRLWLAVDVTHADLVGEQHVRLARGPDYSACAPVRGVRLGGAGESLDVAISMAELCEP
jgi:transglutaminase-like putative cysteine protease